MKFSSARNRSFVTIRALAIIVLALATVCAHTQTMSMGQTTKPDGKLTRVEDHKKICMLTNRAYDKDLIPIEVEGRTYYGCCNMCKTMLAKDPTQREAIDLISKKSVDKSLAVIGVSSNGAVAYFENEKNLEAYNAAH
jgi:YHS domain-containing protein